jgi:hypothetical protein
MLQGEKGLCEDSLPMESTHMDLVIEKVLFTTD